MTTDAIKVLHVLTVRYGPNGITRCAMNYITHFTGTRADLACGFMLPDGVAADFANRESRAVSLPPRLRRPIAYLRALTALMREEAYDLIQVHGNSCTMALELYAARRGGIAARVPHAHNTRCLAKLLHKLLRPVFEHYRTGAFACGVAAGEWLYRGKPFTVVKNAIDTEAFAFDEAIRTRARGALGLDGCFVLGHVGGFNAQKNQAFLLDILLALQALDRNAVLLMVGDGETRPEIERRAAEMGLADAVRVVSGTDDVAPLYAAMDAFLLPSLFEGLPFTLIEAQASGLPCYAADVVTREADMSGLVTYVDAARTAADWAAMIQASGKRDRAAASARAQESIAQAGYSIADEAAALEALYRHAAREARA